jgi:hypothetical protein
MPSALASNCVHQYFTKRTPRHQPFSDDLANASQRPLHLCVCLSHLQVVGGFLKRSREAAAKEEKSGGLLDKLNLEDFASVLDNAPPGTDELVALSKVISVTYVYSYGAHAAYYNGYVSGGS